MLFRSGQIPVIAGTGANCTQNVIDFSQKVEKLGVDGLLVVTPYYNKATQNGLYAHYAAIAGAVGLPIIMYNVPSRTGCNILPQTAARLGRDFENIVGIKEASGNISQVAKLKKLAGNDLDIYSGNDDQVIPIQINYLSITNIHLILLSAETVGIRSRHTLVIRLDNQVNLSELTCTTGLFLMTVIRTGRFRNRLTIRDLRLQIDRKSTRLNSSHPK